MSRTWFNHRELPTHQRRHSRIAEEIYWWLIVAIKGYKVKLRSPSFLQLPLRLVKSDVSKLAVIFLAPFASRLPIIFTTLTEFFEEIYLFTIRSVETDARVMKSTSFSDIRGSGNWTRKHLNVLEMNCVEEGGGMWIKIRYHNSILSRLTFSWTLHSTSNETIAMIVESIFFRRSLWLKSEVKPKVHRELEILLNDS